MTLRELKEVAVNSLIMVKKQNEDEFHPLCYLSPFEQSYYQIVKIEGTKYPMYDDVLEVTVK